MNPETVAVSFDYRFHVLQPYFIVVVFFLQNYRHYEPGCEKRKALRGEIHKNTRRDALIQHWSSTSVYVWELRTRQLGLFVCWLFFYVLVKKGYIANGSQD